MKLLHTLLSAALCCPLLASCETLAGVLEEPPVVLQVNTEGWARVYTDVEHAVVLGEGAGGIEARYRGSEIPKYQYTWFAQWGDYILIDHGESHHFSYPTPLPAKSRGLFTLGELEYLKARGVNLVFEEEEVPQVTWSETAAKPGT